MRSSTLAISWCVDVFNCLCRGIIFFKVVSHALRPRNSGVSSQGPVNESDAGTPKEGLVRTFPYDYEHMTRELEEIDFETLSHDCLIEHSDPSGYCTTHNCVAYTTMVIVFLVPNSDECRFFRSS